MRSLLPELRKTTSQSGGRYEGRGLRASRGSKVGETPGKLDFLQMSTEESKSSRLISAEHSMKRTHSTNIIGVRISAR